MDKIRVRNLRCLEDTGDIELKPLTFLLGVNSVGKSTFLRTFPLLRQSIEMRTGSGLLLNEPYVDYGLFPVALRKGADPAEMTFDFVFDRSDAQTANRSGFSRLESEPDWPIRCAVTFAARTEEQRYSFVRRLTIVVGASGEDQILCEAREDGKLECLKINNDVLTDEATTLRLRPERGPLPKLVRAVQGTDTDEIVYASEDMGQSSFIKRLIAETADLFHANTLAATKEEILRAIRIGTPSAMLQSWRQAALEAGNQKLQNSLKVWKVTDARFLHLRNIIIASRLGGLLLYLSGRLQEFARAVHYFAPVRAGVLRDYLSRDLQVESVDPDGTNVAMVLNSLNNKERVSFNTWTRQHLGLTVHAMPTGDGSRVALRLREETSGVEFNLADMGFGYSQLLPFIVQLWALSFPEIMLNRRGVYRMNFAFMSAGSLFAVEQPELHLHPALQAKVADLFANVAVASRKRGIPVRFVIETHSPTLIERIGQLIAAGRFESGDAQVLIFDRQEGSLAAKIRKCGFNDDGTLDDEFPFGFFLPPIDDLNFAIAAKSDQ